MPENSSSGKSNGRFGPRRPFDEERKQKNILKEKDIEVRVTIIGGAGGMGKWFSGFFEANNMDVRIVDKDKKTEKIAKELKVGFFNVDVLQERQEIIEEVVNTDILLISVPIDITAGVIERVGPLMKEGSLIMDITSVKRTPVDMMEKFTKEGVEILGTHPLFGPDTKGIEGKTIIFVPLRRGSLYEKIYEVFEKNGAKIEFLSAQKHDEIMAIIQGLTHFILISLGITLKDLNLDVEASRKYMSPMSEMLIDFVSRILNQDPHLYAMIQMNLETKKIHEAFLSTAKRLYEMISMNKKEELMEEMKIARKALYRKSNMLNKE